MNVNKSHLGPAASALTDVANCTEFELKFSSDISGLQRVATLKELEKYPFSRRQRIHTVYYDTPNGHLLQQGISLRLRQVGRKRAVQTFKSQTHHRNSTFERIEIEVFAGPNGFDLAGFDDNVREIIIKATHGLSLEERYITDFYRRTTLVTHDHCQIEIAIDDGHFIANGQTHRLQEIEFELKSGDQASVIEFAQGIALAAGLQLDFTSKAVRCALLAGMIVPERRAARPLQSDMSLDTCINILLSDCLQHFIDHIRPFRDERSPHSVHQMRVGLRRLRAALKMLGKAFPETSFREFSDRARILATGLGQARDCDAFQQLAFADCLTHSRHPKDAAHLQTGLGILRARAYESASTLIDSRETLSFILDMQAYCARRGWRGETIDTHFPILSGPADIFARVFLEDLFKRVRKRGKDLLDRSDEERHEFRIALKNLRYIAGFFVTLFNAPKAAKSWLTDLAELQDLLGLHNDLANATLMLERIAPLSKEPFPQAAGFVLGWYACQSEAADKRLDKAWKRLKAHKSFWI